MEAAVSERRDRFVQSAIAISRALIKIGNDKSLDLGHRCIVLRIATNLQLTHDALKSTPVFWIGREVDEVCRSLIENFGYINTVCLSTYPSIDIYITEKAY